MSLHRLDSGDKLQTIKDLCRVHKIILSKIVVQLLGSIFD